MKAFILIVGLATGVGYSQPSWGDMLVEVSPKEIEPGDSTRFKAGLFSANQCPYQSTYSIGKAGEASPDSFVVLIRSEPTGGQCALAYGYSGPALFITGHLPGKYSIRFDSGSKVRMDMGDTAVFLVKSGTTIPRKLPSGVKAGDGNRVWRVNGQMIRYKPSVSRDP